MGIAAGVCLFRLVALVIASSANATLIDHGTYLTDTITGLDWLDVILSRNMSYLDVSAQFGIGGEFSGWQYATVNEVEGLWTSAGLLPGIAQACSPSPPCLAVYDPLPPLAQLIGLLGDTTSQSLGFTGVMALTSTPYGSPWPGCSPYTCIPAT
jgi:hypothetical protein